LPAEALLGAIGHPDVKPGILEVGILLRTRFALDRYINLQPVKRYPNVETPLKDKGPEHVDFVVVRENTGGIYTGVGGVTQKGTPLEVATQVMQYSRPVVGSCGKPPSSARRVPAREGMETLPGISQTGSRPRLPCRPSPRLARLPWARRSSAHAERGARLQRTHLTLAVGK
jgi:hypothetical protein